MIDRVIILPYGEEFNENSAGAAGIFVKESLQNQKIKKYKPKISSSFVIYGSTRKVYKKLKKIYVQSGPEKKFFSNANYIENFIKKFEKKIIKNIEIHNRPVYAKKLIEAFPNSKIFIFYHNDPRKLRGSKSVEERNLLNNKCVNIFLSKYIKNCFYFGLENKYNKKNLDILYPGVKKINEIKNKKKIILFTGKLNEAKGYDLFVKESLQNQKIKKYKPKISS
ncbi:MAG: hypothetical protein EBZ99_05335, partial [Actinobacteria bacterium]|nr:hypothetical protein [Actinomycetota bacterium]